MKSSTHSSEWHATDEMLALYNSPNIRSPTVPAHSAGAKVQEPPCNPLRLSHPCAPRSNTARRQVVERHGYLQEFIPGPF